MQDSELDDLLRLWAMSIIRESEISMQPAWAKKVNIRSTIVVIPSYWPNRRLWRINDGILSLQTDKRNAITGKYVLGYSERRIAHELNKTRYAIRVLFRDARKDLLENLTNQPNK